MSSSQTTLGVRTGGVPDVDAITRESAERLLKEKILQLGSQPEFRWEEGQNTYEVDPDGTPAVRVAVAGCSVDFDLWANLRNPAKVGIYPVGFQEIWEYYANNRKKRTDASGRATIFQLSEPFIEAKKRYNRVLIISALLPLSKEIYATYNQYVHDQSFSPWDGYCRAWSECNQLLDRGITRLAMSLSSNTRVVVAMNEATVEKISTEALPLTRQGASHGVCKGVNYPQKSIAVLTGLAQFGISRLVFRDEIVRGEARRLMGPLRSIVIFHSDEEDTSHDSGILPLSTQWQEKLKSLSDFTVSDPDVNRHRFCTYLAGDDEQGCGKCLAFCPSNALANSSPGTKGQYPKRLLDQEHRFWDGSLQFDNGSCCDDRGQLKTLYDEWMCGRCVAICAAEGNHRAEAANLWEGYRAG